MHSIFKQVNGIYEQNLKSLLLYFNKEIRVYRERGKTESLAIEAHVTLSSHSYHHSCHCTLPSATLVISKANKVINIFPRHHTNGMIMKQLSKR